MEDLIKRWEGLSKRYYKQAQSCTSDSWSSDLSAAAATLQSCADELKRECSQTVGQDE
jgi:uncharacterized protein YukE